MRALAAFVVALLAAACTSELTGHSDNAPPRPRDGAPGVVPPSDAGEHAGDARLDAPPARTLGTLDRVGKAYVSLILVSPANRADYNLAPVEQVFPKDPPREGGPPTFGADFQSTLTKLDAIDGTNQWDGGAANAGPDDAGLYPHPLANAWVSADALIIDPSKPFSLNGYLDIEVNGLAATTCGGRWLNDDALDKTMSFLIKRTLSGVSDRVSAPARPATTTFPYLAAPF
jgi:hypothetical protein